MSHSSETFNTEAQVLFPSFTSSASSEESHKKSWLKSAHVNRNNPSRPSYAISCRRWCLCKQTWLTLPICRLQVEEKYVTPVIQVLFTQTIAFDYCCVTDQKSTDGFCITSSDWDDPLNSDFKIKNTFNFTFFWPAVTKWVLPPLDHISPNSTCKTQWDRHRERERE